MIHCEFRKINSASGDADTRLAQFTLPAVPSRGELININGNPYIVFERAWAVGDDTDEPHEDCTIDEMWCYLRVVPHHR
jgi:hypothetical protein